MTTGDNPIERVLFNDYRYYRNYTAHVQKLKQSKPYLRDLKETPKRLKLFAELAMWCCQQGVDPRQWLYSLFVSRHWMYAPKLEKAHLCSKKHLSRFQKFSDYQFFTQRQIQEQAVKITPTTFDPNRDINTVSENAKRHYLLNHDTAGCMSKMNEETFGFHPQSTACARCPAQTECRVELERRVSFDILALRRGEMTSEQAKAQAVARVQGYGG